MNLIKIEDNLTPQLFDNDKIMVNSQLSKSWGEFTYEE